MNLQSLTAFLPFLATLMGPWVPALSEKFQEHPEWVAVSVVAFVFFFFLLLRLFSRLVDDLARFLLDNCKSAIILLILEVTIAVYVFGWERIMNEVKTF